MASGYEKSEDYGGKPPSWLGGIAIVIFIVLISVFIIENS